MQILSWETSTEQLRLGQLTYTSCLVDSQQPQIPIIKWNKYICVTATTQIILLD